MIEVAAGVLLDAQGRVLLLQRLPGKHLAGLWEFPGGKLEPGEDARTALARELDEELGIEVLAAEPLISVPWQYPGKSVRLHAWCVTAWHGEPRAREGHPLRWVDVTALDGEAMPAADVPIVTALRLPVHCIIADSAEGLSKLLSRWDCAGEVAGASAVVRACDPAQALCRLRLPGRDRDEVRRVATLALAAQPRLHGDLLVNHDIELARELGVGVHLQAAQLQALTQRPLPRGVLVGASCHDAEELERAARLGVDFATLSPVRATSSHPGAEPLGWDRFTRFVADARLPVYALGGVGADDLERARGAGAQGVAGIRAYR